MARRGVVESSSVHTPFVYLYGHQTTMWMIPLRERERERERRVSVYEEAPGFRPGPRDVDDTPYYYTPGWLGAVLGEGYYEGDSHIK